MGQGSSGAFPGARSVVVLLAGLALCCATLEWRLQADRGLLVAVASTSAGLLLLVAGSMADRERPANPIGLLIAGAGCAVFAEDLVKSDVPLLHTAGLLLVHAATPLLVHVALAFPRGRLERWWTRGIVAFGYATAFGISFAQAFVDGSMEIDVRANLLLVDYRGETLDALTSVQEALTAALACLVMIAVVARAGRAAAGDRKVMMIVATGVVAAAGAVLAGEALGRAHPWSTALIVVFYTVTAGLAGAIILMLLRLGDGLRAVALAAADIAPGSEPADAETILRRLLRDPTVQLARWDPAAGAFIDREGRPLPPAEPPSIARAQYASAAMRYWDNGFVHERTVLALLGVVDASFAAPRLAASLRDALRRDLHDGPQQRLTALALRLRLMEDAAGVGSDASPIARVRGEVERTQSELRTLARGDALDSLGHGLGRAVRELAERTPLPVTVELEGVGEGDLPEPTVRCAYFVVAEGVTNALRHAHPSSVRVRCIRRDGILRIEVADDGTGEVALVDGGGLRGLEARVEARGGAMTTGRDPRITVVLPCGAG